MNFVLSVWMADISSYGSHGAYAANYNHKRVPIKLLMKTDFLLQVIINRKNLNCLVKIAISYSVGRWEWVYLFPQNLWKESRENPQDQFPFFFKILVRLLRNRKGKSAKNRERGKREKFDGRFYSEKTEFWRPKSKWIYYAMEERILISIILLGIEKKGTLSFESIVCGAFFFF